MGITRKPLKPVDSLLQSILSLILMANEGLSKVEWEQYS